MRRSRLPCRTRHPRSFSFLAKAGLARTVVHGRDDRSQDESRMSYVAEILQPGETLRFSTNIHWFVYLKAILALIVGLVLLGWYYAEGQSVFVLLFGGVVFTLTAVILAVPAWLRRFGTEVAVTDRRVIYKTGLIQ